MYVGSCYHCLPACIAYLFIFPLIVYKGNPTWLFLPVVQDVGTSITVRRMHKIITIIA